MTREGELYDCGVCGGKHTIKIDRSGMPTIFGHVYYVECPKYGEIVWTETT